MTITRLKYLRLQKDLTQKDLADAISVRPSQISFLEKGRRKISIANLYILSVLLGYTGKAEDLLDIIEVEETGLV